MTLLGALPARGRGVLGLVGSAAGGLDGILPKLIEPMAGRSWRVAVTLIPTAVTWLDATGDIEKIEQVTGLSVRVKPRLPGAESPHPKVDCYAVVPATSNTVGKLALGLADNQASPRSARPSAVAPSPSSTSPASTPPTPVSPHGPATSKALARVGVDLIMGDDVWPLHEPRSAPGR